MVKATNEAQPASAISHVLNSSEDAYQFPCTLVQRTCWFLDRISPGSAAYNIAVRFLLSGDLVPSRLEEALRQVIARHEILRTRFVDDHGEPKQLVEPHVAFSLPVVNLRGLPPGERESEAERLAAEEATVGFDVETGPLFRAKLLHTDTRQFTLLITMHHIISDGWSVGIITDEMGWIYEALSDTTVQPPSPLPIQYGDYACWQEEWVSSGRLGREVEELRCQLDGFQPLRIPTDFARPAGSGSQGQIRSILLPKQLTNLLKRFSEKHECTMFVTMLSAFLALLHTQSQQNELTIRTQTAGRDRVELESLIGWFVNSIVLRTSVPRGGGFKALLENTRRVVMEAFEYQHVPFERLMEVIRPAQAPPRHPPFQVNFIFQRDFVRPWRRAGVTMTPIPSKATGTFVDLNFFLVEREDGWRASVDVNTDVFRVETGEFLLRCYQQILERIARSGNFALNEIALPPRPFPPDSKERSETYRLDNHVPPRNEHEIAVVEIWERVLGVSGVGAYSNFFDLGGHSLKAVRLLSEFQARFGRELKIPQLFADPTPAAMAAVLSGEITYADSRDLIPIQAQGNRPPFFLVGGDHWFRPLAKFVGLDQPFIGMPLLKYRHLDIGRERMAIAAELAKLLIAEHSGTPFLLGGWCADGLTAYEVGRALHAAGERVQLVVLFDAINPEYYRAARSLVHSAGRTVTSVQHIWKAASAQGLIAGLPALWRLMGGVFRRLSYRLLDRVHRDYSSQPASFPVLVIRPPSAPLEQPDLGWGRACPSGLTVVEVPGDHSSIFREPNVQVLGWKLREQLDLALQKQRAHSLNTGNQND